jgi:flagellar protein FliS
MSQGARARDAYRQTELQSRTPLELVAMLYDGAIRFTSQARQAVERRDIPARRDAVSRAIAIVSELQSTLDVERGGDVAVSLDRLYAFVIERLLAASFKQDSGPLDEALQVLNTLREGWTTIAAPAAAAK